MASACRHLQRRKRPKRGAEPAPAYGDGGAPGDGGASGAAAETAPPSFAAPAATVQSAWTMMGGSPVGADTVETTAVAGALKSAEYMRALSTGKGVCVRMYSMAS